MEKLELDKLVMKWIEEKKKRPSRINRPLTYTLYNELLKPKMRRSEKDCTCLDRDSDYKVTNHIENHYKLETPLPIASNVEIELEGMTKPKTTKKKTTRKRKTKKKDEGTKPNAISAKS